MCVHACPFCHRTVAVVFHALTPWASTSWQYYDQDPVELVEDVKEEIKSEGGKEKNEL